MEIVLSKPDVEASKVAKRSRDDNHNAIVTSKKPKIDLQLVDINDDCLEMIFKHLGLVDLVNVAESDERFVAAAQTVYLRKYRMKKAHLYFKSIYHDPIDNFEIRKDIAEAFFRQFGHLVSDISIFFSTKSIHIETALLSHCSDSLTVLRLAWCTSVNFKTLNKPLKNVDTLTIVNSILNRHSSQLNIWFPSVVSLELTQVGLMQSEVLDLKFAQLKHLTISSNERIMSQTTIREMLHLNPQLESLKLKYKLDVDFLQCIADCLPLVEKLELWAPQDGFEDFEDRKFLFENVKEFKLNSWHDSDESLVCVPFEFKNLQKLTFNGFNEFKGDLLNFVEQNQEISTLSLMPYLDFEDDLTYNDVEVIIESHPKLIELECCGDGFTNDELIWLLSMKTLKKVQLWFYKQPEFARFRSAAKAEWTLCDSIESHGLGRMWDYCMVFERKN